MTTNSSFIPAERIESLILLVRGEKVMLDTHLARLYGTTTKRLNEGVRRNLNRFPADFMFELTDREAAAVTYPWCSRSREWHALVCAQK